MDNKELAIALAKCDSEKDIISILKNEHKWDDSACWRAFGDNDNNWSTIGNQQSEADAALVEKIVNSIDALLMKECLKRRIEPTSENAPKNIEEALETFFGITGGKLQNLTGTERTRLAQDNIILAATGNKGTPNYVIVDRGEGQTPKRMPDTILSINKSNKLKVPFVQGKFNMGGTGVLCFCGSNNFQLIISKRCPELPRENDSTHDLWGVTIVRRERPNSQNGQRSSKYVYLTDKNGDILTFEADAIEIIPTSKRDKDGNILFKPMEYGMFCKVYEYKIATRLRTNINMGLFNRLSMLLPNLAYPVYLDECRDYGGHTMFRTLSGLNVRLSDQLSDVDSNIEDMVSVSFTIDGQKVDASVYVFKNKTEKGTKVDMSQYRNTEGVLLVQNGQTHGVFDKRFYNRSTVGLSYLSDWMLTVVDCSHINEATREELFMNSRDRTRASMFAFKLEEELEEYLKENETLRKIQAVRREKAISERIEDEKPLEEVLSSVFKSSQVLSRLFIQGERLSNPVKLTETNSNTEYKGKYNPTFFTIISKKKNKDGVVEKDAQISRKCRVKFDTDANNDFFTRDKYPGKHELIRVGAEEVEDYSLNLRDGIATLNISLPQEAQVGSRYLYEFVVADTNVDREFKNTFCINVIDTVDSSGGGGGRSLPPGHKNDKNAIMPSGIALPKVTEVKREEWDEHGFVKESALQVLSDGDGGYDFFINMDNIHLQTEIKPVAKDEAKINLLKSRYKYSMVLVGLSVLGYYKNKKDKEETMPDSEEISSEYQAGLVAEIVSPILLPMIDKMGTDMNDLID